MTAEANGHPAPPSPGEGHGVATEPHPDQAWNWQLAELGDQLDAPELPPTWEDRAQKLLALLMDAAVAKGVASRAHARAWMAGAGPAVQRDQQAKLAAAGAVLGADVAKARVEAYRLLLDAQRLADLGGAS